MSKYFVIIDGVPRDLVFRKYDSLSKPGSPAYHVDFDLGLSIGRMGFVIFYLGTWRAHSFSLNTEEHLRQVDGFATRRDAAFYIARTYGWGKKGTHEIQS